MGKTTSYSIESPVGTLHVHVERDVPVDLTFSGEARGCEKGQLPPPPAVAEFIQAIESYFRGEDVGAVLAENLLGCINATDFEKAVLGEVARIPRGETASYGEVAVRAGYPRAARAVGNVMHSNPFPIIIPCHRVIKSDGNLGGYGGEEQIKAWLLRFEGFEVNDHRLSMMV